MKNIIIGSDHAGYNMKITIVNFLKQNNYEVIDVGCYSSESVDYTDYAHKVAKIINNDTSKIGILICGSGNGVCMTANKYNNIRAALAWNKDIAYFARLHNDANILCLPGRYITDEEAIQRWKDINTK